MNIQKIGYKNTPFMSVHRIYPSESVKNFNSFGTKYIHTKTYLFREDLDWQSFIRFVLSHFSDKDKVNVYSLASSDGSEAFSFAISIMEKGKDLISKYLPVKACDIDIEMIKAGSSGSINVYDEEFKEADRLGINLRKYLTKPVHSKRYTGDEAYLCINASSYELIPELKNSVEFKHSDILTELKNVKDEGNSIVMCRNVLPYQSASHIDEIIKTAYDVLKKGSLFVIGDFDTSREIDTKLLSNGFFKPSLENYNIFQRGESKEFTDRLLMGYLI